jgi:hypothetical protein
MSYIVSLKVTSIDLVRFNVSAMFSKCEINTMFHHISNHVR